MPVSRDGADGLRNVLGETSEFFTGVPAFSRCFGNGFFVLECETLTRRTPQQVDTSQAGDDDTSGDDEGSDDDDDDEEEEDASLYVKGKRTANSIAYMITESERFAPPR